MSITSGTQPCSLNAASAIAKNGLNSYPYSGPRFETQAGTCMLGQMSQRLLFPLTRQLVSCLRQPKQCSFPGMYQAVSSRTACSPVCQRGRPLCTPSAMNTIKDFIRPSVLWRVQTSGWWHQYHITHMYRFLNRPLFLFGNVTQTRNVTYGKRGKRKTVKAVAKRFIRTGSGKLKYWPAGKHHNMLAKSCKRRRQLRKARYVNKTQLKTLNKMLSGW